MAFKYFGWLMMVRVALLTLTLVGFSAALTATGYYGITVLLAVLAVIEVFELYRYASKTNAELSRFLEAARYDDFAQRFQSVHQGAGFDQLADRLSDIMQRFNNTRQQQEEQLQHLKALTEHIPVPLLSLYPDGQIQLRNNAARHLFARINVNKIDDLKVFGEDFYTAINHLQPGNRQLVNFSDDGMERQLAVVMSEIVSASVSENLISMQDIQSELDGVQLQAWEDLVRVLTHEIMNSITPVASLAKTATSLVDDVRVKLNNNADVAVVLDELEDVHRAVDTVARRSDSLMQFVQSYRSLTQLPSPQKKMLVLIDLFEPIERLLTGLWNSKDITLSVTVEPEDLALFADPDLIEQVLINLLQNAEQALSGSGNAQPQVTMIARMNQRGHVLIEVSDNGPGIDEDIAREIFIPFFTTKQQGSGVGLALTRQVMMAHGGSVTLGRSDAGGARFRLVF